MNNSDTHYSENEIFSESDIINSIKRFIDPNKANLLGYYEDAVAFKIGEEIVILNIDGWVGSTDRPESLSLHDCGYRAVINAASDIIVKGGSLSGMVVSLSLPKTLLNNIQEIISGISKAARDYNINYLGGDINSCTDFVIDVTVWGSCNKKIIRRNGAKTGQKLCWWGPPLGSTAAALGVLTNNWKGNKYLISKSLEIMGRPRLYPDFHNINAGSAIDCSDGLAKSLYHLAESSQVGFDLFEIKNLEKWIVEIAKLNDNNIQELALYGGEELAIIFTCDRETILPEEVIVLGKVIEGNKITINGFKIENRGWDHFSSD